MKKIFVITLVLLTLVTILSACSLDINNECTEHIWSDYKSNEYVHWREYTCGCPWPEIVQEHINHDGDLLCDICGYTMMIPSYDVCEHTWGDYKSNEYVHWREYTCGCPWPEIVEEHVNVDADSLCDICGHTMSTEVCEHTWGNQTYNYMIAGHFTVEKVKRCTLCGTDSPAINYGDGNVYKIEITAEDATFLLSELPTHAKSGTPFVIAVPDMKNADVSIIINGLYYDFFARINEEGEYENYRPFVVPTEDIFIDVVIDYYSDDYMLLIEEYNNFANTDSAKVHKYYGKYASGALVAEMTSRDEAYLDVICYDSVAEYVFVMGNSNVIRVLYNGEFYRLAEAYANGYLTYDDVAEIYKIHTSK